MKPNKALERLRRGESVLGCALGLGSAAAAELLSRIGFDWLSIETEHNALDAAEIERLLMAMSGGDATPLVRVPSAQGAYIQRALDFGAFGIVAPMISTANEATAFVRACRYPPRGTRGFGPVRAASYGLDNEDYFRHANDRLLLTAIIETREAVQNLAEIAAVEGLDVLLMGPFDLCLSLGLDPLHQPHAEIERIYSQALALGCASGVAIGINVSNVEQLRARREQGFRFLGYGPDYGLLAAAASEGIAAFSKLGEPTR